MGSFPAAKPNKIHSLNADGELFNAATKEKQDAIIDALTGASKDSNSYAYQAKSVTSTYKYFFFEDRAGGWMIKRKTLSTGVFNYAKGTGGYDSVYDSPTTDPTGSLTWGSYGEIF